MKRAEKIENAAIEYCRKMNYILSTEDKPESLEAGTAIDAFKAGVEWVKGRMLKRMEKEGIRYSRRLAKGYANIAEEARIRWSALKRFMDNNL